MEELLKALEKSQKSTGKEIKELHAKYEPLKNEPKGPEDLSNLAPSYDRVVKYGPSFSFSKRERFAKKTTQGLEEQSFMSNLSTCSTVDSEKNWRGPLTFAKSKRFSETSSSLSNSALEINPNYKLVKPSVPGVAIKRPYGNSRQAKSKAAEKEKKEPVLVYDVKYDAVENRKKAAVFPKSKRFQAPKAEELQDINPKIDAVRPGVKGTVIKKDIPTNPKLAKKKKEEDERENYRARFEMQKPIEKDKFLLKNVQTRVYQPASNTQHKSPNSRLMWMFYLLEKYKNDQRRAPGEYYVERRPKVRSGVVYRSSSTEIRKWIPEKTPGPASYYAKDDMIREHQPKFSFNKEAKHKKVKLEDLDLRKPLSPEYDFVKPRVKAAVINPPREEPSEPELYKLKLGPGAYEINYAPTEMRTDIGVLPFILTEKNDRDQLINFAKKDVFDGELNPNYDFDKPNKPVFRYHEDTVWGPEHVPDNKLFKEIWKFYDVDLDVVRPEIAPPISFANNKDRNVYLDHETLRRELVEYLERKRRNPEVGQYQVRYGQIDKNVPVPDFEKYQERDSDSPKPKEEGDILILNPTKPRNNIPTIDFGKMEGRPEAKERNEMDPELIIEPKYDLIDKRPINLVDMNKQTERQEPKRENHDALDLNVKFEAVERKVQTADFTKPMAREDDPRFNPKPKEDVIKLDVKDEAVKPRIGTGVKMDKGEKRFKEADTNENKNPGQPTTGEKIDYEKVMKAIKPNVGTVGFEGYSGREKPKIQKKQKPADKESPDADGLDKVDAHSVVISDGREEAKEEPVDPKGDRLSAVYGIINKEELLEKQRKEGALGGKGVVGPPKEIAPWEGEDHDGDDM